MDKAEIQGGRVISLSRIWRGEGEEQLGIGGGQVDSSLSLYRRAAIRHQQAFRGMWGL